MNTFIRKAITIVSLTTAINVFGIKLVLAQQPPVAAPQVRIRDIGQIYGLLGVITNWLFAFFFAVAIIFILWGGWSYLTDPGGKGAEAGKKKLMQAIIAIIIALVARGMPTLIQAIIGMR